MLICHRCNEKLCVNPKHLYVGTSKENVADMIAAGQHRGGTNSNPNPPRGEASNWAKLTEEEVLEIYRRVTTTNESHRSIGADYGISSKP